MTDQEYVSFKEYFLALLKEREKALELQANEYQRRLKMLNNENARIAEAARASVPKGEYIIQMNVIDRRLSKLEEVASFSAGSHNTWIAGGGLLYFIVVAASAIIALGVSFFVK